MSRDDLHRALRLSVLDRLIDDDPRSSVEAPMTRAQSERAYKEAVRRDLEWLLNSRATPQAPPAGSTQLRKSVFAYGLPDITTLSGDSPEDRDQLRTIVEEAIAVFEPRLSNVTVSAAESSSPGARNLRFAVRATLRLDPQPMQVVYDAMLDLTSRSYRVKE